MKHRIKKRTVVSGTPGKRMKLDKKPEGEWAGNWKTSGEDWEKLSGRGPSFWERTDSGSEKEVGQPARGKSDSGIQCGPCGGILGMGTI